MPARFFLGSTQTVTQFVAAELFPFDRAEAANYCAARTAEAGPPLRRKKGRRSMKTRQVIILIGLSLVLLSSESFAQSGTCAGMDIGPGADLNGFIPFPADNAWNTDISSMPVDPNSANIIAFI
jgi:hypothetical protein